VRHLHVAALALFAVLAAGCADAYWVAGADQAAADVLAEKSVGFDDFRANGLVMPEGEAEGETRGPTPEELEDVPSEVGLKEALAIATRFNRNYQSERESLYLSALALTTVRNQFSFLFTGTLSAILTDTDLTHHSNINRAELGVSKILPTGGTVRLDGSTTTTGDGAAGGYRGSSSLGVSIAQPLLRDAGYETSHAALTQAERNVVYAIRDFELFREDFTIDVTRRYFALLQQLREIENAEEEEKSRLFLTEQSIALFEVGEASEVDKLRSEREYLRTKNDVITQKEAYRLSLDRFKILLGLPTSFPLEIRPEDPVFKMIPINLESAITAALNNRLDLRNSRDELEDAEREVRLAANRLLPDLDFDARYTLTSPADRTPLSQAFEDNFYTLGLTLDIPFERTSERNAYRRALIELERSRRGVSLTEDNVVLEVRDAVRRLRRVQATLDIRREELAAAKKEEKAANYRFDDGEADNQDVSVAQAAVRRARNSLIADLIEFETGRIQLLRDIGILFVDDQGMWVEP
jgi:outer membrane protein TolC